MGSPEWLSVSTPYVTPIPESDPDAWSAEAAEHGGVGTQRLLEVTEVVPPTEVAEALQVEPETRVIVRRRLMLFDDQPVELADSYYPISIADGTALAESRKIRGGAIRLLAELGYRPAQVREDVYTRRPTEVERASLRLAAHDWVLGLARLLSTRAGLPVEASVMTMVPQGRRLRYQLSTD